MMKYIIESDNSDSLEIAERLESIDIIMTYAPAEMSHQQSVNLLKVRNLLSKARTIIEDADDIASTLWSD